jgi:prepilin peptidase CpaA
MDKGILDIIIIAVGAVALGVGVYTDLRYGKIYNALTLPCMALGVTLNVGAHGLSGLFYSLGAVGLVLVLFLLFAPAAGIGGGDVKLMMAVGSLLGLKLLVWAILFSAIFGGVLALIVMLRRRALLATTRNMAGNLYMSAVLRAPVDLSTGGRGMKFRYSPAIALGTVLALLVKHG